MWAGSTITPVPNLKGVRIYKCSQEAAIRGEVHAYEKILWAEDIADMFLGYVPDLETLKTEVNQISEIRGLTRIALYPTAVATYKPSGAKQTSWMVSRFPV